jgi:hypothetical protein
MSEALTLLDLLDGTAKEPWITILEDVVKIALPALLNALAGNETAAEIAAGYVAELLGVAEKAIVDLASQVPEVQARRDYDNGMADILERAKVGGATPAA